MTAKRRITNAHKQPEQAGPKRGSASAVQEYFERNPDGHVWASDIMTATGLSKAQVQQAISYLRSTAGMTNIVIIRPGNAWRYNPNRPKMAKAANPEPRQPDVNGVPTLPAHVVVVGVYDDNSIALSVDGKPYHAKPLS